MRSFPLLVSLVVVLAVTTPCYAGNLGGGSPGSGGLVPELALDRWIPGQNTALTFSNLSPSAGTMGVMIGTRTLDFPLVVLGTARLKVDLSAPGTIVLSGLSPANPSLPLGTLPSFFEGVKLFIQGFVVDPGAVGGIAFTNGTEVDFFSPLAMVGNSRQSSNSIHVIHGGTNTLLHTILDSENGRIEYSPDRRCAYVTETGGGRNRVQIYDLTLPGCPNVGSLFVSGSIHPGLAVSPDGTRLYVTVHNGISVFDIVPLSPSYGVELTVLPASITGSQVGIGFGPLDVAVSPNGQKLYIAYSEPGTFPSTSGNIGIMDVATGVETLVPITNGGDFFGIVTRMRIKVSWDGLYVYALELGVDPTFPFVNGFTTGGMLNVVDTQAGAEAAAVPTGGWDQQEFALERLGRYAHVAHRGVGGAGEVATMDLRVGSASRFSFINTLAIGGVTYSGEAGPRGIDVTPDGSTLFVSVIEGSQNPTPELWILDAFTGTNRVPPIPVGSLCRTLSVQQR